MDFGGAMTMETIQESGNNISKTVNSPTETNNSSKISNGSGQQLKQERSGPCDETNWRPSKVQRAAADDYSALCKQMPQQQGPTNPTLFMRSGSPNNGRGHSTMLSFSSPKSDELIPFLSTTNASVQDSSKSLAFPLFDPGSHYSRASAYASGGSNESTHGPFVARFRGPFTPSQWMELEHQALIYKHLVANIPVPHQLLIPLKKSLNPYAFSGLSSGSYASNWGWGTFHLGFTGNTDPEPGRCRRTDGKKWRCSREAVPDQKYCERHINRGRHRSRKPVEGQNGHAVSGSTTSKVASVAPSSSATVISSSGTSNSLGAVQHQFNSLQPSAANPSTEQLVSRMQDHKGVSMISPTIGLKPKDSAISIQKQHNGFELSSLSEFGLVSSDSLLNPSQRSSFVNPKSSNAFIDFNDQEQREQHPVHHFIDGWTKEQSSRASASWPDELKSDWTQLSMSIPMAASDFSSSSNSPRQEKLTLSPLRLSRDFDPIQMGLGVTNSHGEPMQKTANWLPVSWENALGGPLGEVLNSTAGNAGDAKNSSALNLATEMWDNSPPFGSSPTGVLQKSTFVSLSNSSSGGSPRSDSKKVHEGAGVCDEVIGSTLASSLCIPSM
ncbi:PREDICTED: growth-regulating factor 1-like [Nicotiana attenuata]|uniref:Growth-regulating factor n=1 Tax=Nicotiana attenuata TaxID=49451 RepID=A0A314L788_NICAT|nr:PREDICTED: growth-regulating factor 1-like [Nicotiana attenuata]OIT37486.1 growth-regulating factor 1 [Nicotiana attenuata]